MTVDLSKVTYKVIAILKTGSQLDLTPVCQSISWEENESEYSTRLNLKVQDVEYQGDRLAYLLPLCTVLYLFADWGEGVKEVWRGTVWEWSFPEEADSAITIVGYDFMYYMQKSQDCRYYAKGKSTKAIIEDICKAWKIQMGEYKGPEEKHKKMLFKTKAISAMLQEALEDAEDMGAAKCFCRAKEGKLDILPFGTNEEVFVFREGENITSASDKYSMTNLITRIIITGKADKKGRPKVESKIDGHTEYGIIQSYQNKGSDTIANAKNAAKKTLKDKGEPKRTTSIGAPDFPLIRKGDRIMVEVGRLEGLFKVVGVSHNATEGDMRMEVEPIE